MPDGGTVWSSLREYRISGRRNEFLHDRDDPNIIFIKTFPHTGIGQCRESLPLIAHLLSARRSPRTC